MINLLEENIQQNHNLLRSQTFSEVHTQNNYERKLFVCFMKTNTFYSLKETIETMNANLKAN